MATKMFEELTKVGGKGHQIIVNHFKNIESKDFEELLNDFEN